jgi:dGTPase
MTSDLTSQWSKLLSTKRLKADKVQAEPGRSPFNSDHDRIVFSGAFRRLAKKTQVHPLANNDHVHNRLTHSLEVACVGRSLGCRVGEQISNDLPQGTSPYDIGDIVEAACLAHDIGNPPFGHIGEEAIKHWFSSNLENNWKGAEDQFKDLANFEGNAQGFRIINATEYRVFDGGMRLTCATLGAFMKYPWLNGKGPKADKFGAFLSEEDFFKEVTEELGMKKLGDGYYARHPLAHLMEMADDFCYRLLDMEDAIEMGIIEWKEFHSTFEPVLGEVELSEMTAIERLRPGRRPAALRGKIISAFIDDAAKAFALNERDILNGEIDSLLEKCSAPVRGALGAAKLVAQEKIFNHPRKIELEIGAYSVIRTLMDTISRAIAPDSKDALSSQVLKLIGPSTFSAHSESLEGVSEYERYRRAVDFVSGMTDNYATYLSNQFNGMGGVR